MDLEDLLMEIGKCTRCGFCEVDCPTIRPFHLNRLYGPRGRVQLVGGILRGVVPPSNNTVSSIYTCLLCGSCNQACPAGVDVRGIVRAFRRLIAEGSVLEGVSPAVSPASQQ